MQSLGYSVIAAVDGNDALQELRADTPIDILFTDIVMPGGINGWELADLARQLRPGLPVLLTSGFALETLVKHDRLREGAVVLTKPYCKADLARRLREVVDLSVLAVASGRPGGQPGILADRDGVSGTVNFGCPADRRSETRDRRHRKDDLLSKLR